MNLDQVPSGVLNEDIEYFETKLLTETDPKAQIKIKKQLKALKECFEIYETAKQSGERV